MDSVFYPSSERGRANHGWLESNFSFSFANYYNPAKMNFGALRVLNDDIIAGGTGFGTHAHDNMEIVSIPIYGALEHKDNTGRHEIIKTGDVQIMSAGSGISHSEYNASKTDNANFLQLWIFPKIRNIDARYQQLTFEVAERQNRFQSVVAPIKSDKSLWINQDAWISLGDFDANQTVQFSKNMTSNGIYLFVIDGEINIGSQKLTKRDAVSLTNFEQTEFYVLENCKLLVIEIPMTV